MCKLEIKCQELKDLLKEARNSSLFCSLDIQTGAGAAHAQLHGKLHETNQVQFLGARHKRKR